MLHWATQIGFDISSFFISLLLSSLVLWGGHKDVGQTWEELEVNVMGMPYVKFPNNQEKYYYIK